MMMRWSKRPMCVIAQGRVSAFCLGEIHRADYFMSVSVNA